MDMLVDAKRGDRTSCLAREVLVTFDVQEQVGWSFRISAAGEFGSASTAKGDYGEQWERYRGGAWRNSGCTIPTEGAIRACKAFGWRKGVPDGCHRSVATTDCWRLRVRSWDRNCTLTGDGCAFGIRWLRTT